MGGAISWQVERKSKVSRSTCEAEIRAADTGCKLIQALRHVLEDLSLSDTSVSTPVFNDNQGTVDWSKSFANNRGLHHVNIRNMAVRESQQTGEINIIHIAGANNPSDLLTKEHKDTAHLVNGTSQTRANAAHVDARAISIPNQEGPRITGRYEDAIREHIDGSYQLKHDKSSTARVERYSHVPECG